MKPYSIVFPGRDAVIGDLDEVREAEERARHVPVDGKTGGCQGAGSEGAAIAARERSGQAPEIAAEQVCRGEQVVPEGDRLGVLRVGVARHDCVHVSGRQVDQRLAERRNGLHQSEEPLAEREPPGCHMQVVAAAPGMEPPAHVGPELIDDVTLDV
jgi:hypothetical protein